MRSIGFTGTGKGMTVAQQLTVRDILTVGDPGTFHHGMCQGADDQASEIAAELGWFVVGHPGRTPTGKIIRVGSASHVVDPIKPTLERNHDIAEACDYLIATPRGYHEVRRSGTWSTVRYANAALKPVYVVFPDGRVSDYASLPALRLPA